MRESAQTRRDAQHSRRRPPKPTLEQVCSEAGEEPPQRLTMTIMVAPARVNEARVVENSAEINAVSVSVSAAATARKNMATITRTPGGEKKMDFGTILAYSH